jgi:hypothetical protein
LRGVAIRPGRLAVTAGRLFTDRERAMDDLIKQIMAKSNVGEAVAKSIVKLVVDYFKTKLPPQLSHVLDDVLAGKSPADLQSILGSLGGLGGLGSLLGGGEEKKG